MHQITQLLVLRFENCHGKVRKQAEVAKRRFGLFDGEYKLHQEPDQSMVQWIHGENNQFLRHATTLMTMYHCSYTITVIIIIES